MVVCADNYLLLTLKPARCLLRQRIIPVTAALLLSSGYYFLQGYTVPV
jgi:hypothetical protein